MSLARVVSLPYDDDCKPILPRPPARTNTETDVKRYTSKPISLALEALVSIGTFGSSVDNFVSHENAPHLKGEGFEVGAFMKVSSGFSNREGGRVKLHGLDWLRGYAQEINLKVAETKGAKVRAKSKDKIDQWGADHQVTLRSNLMDATSLLLGLCCCPSGLLADR